MVLVSRRSEGMVPASAGGFVLWYNMAKIIM